MKYEMYRDESVKREWRWRLRATNSKIIAASGEGYANKGDCRDIINSVKASADAPVVEVEK